LDEQKAQGREFNVIPKARDYNRADVWFPVTLLKVMNFLSDGRTLERPYISEARACVHFL
jgi:hypothetical protein